MTLRFTLYALFFLTVSNLRLSAESNTVHLAFVLITQDRADGADIDYSDWMDLLDQDFPCIDEDNSPDNDDGNENQNEGKVFGAEPGGPSQWFLPNSVLFAALPLSTYRSVRGPLAPLFLLHQVFRI